MRLLVCHRLSGLSVKLLKRNRKDARVFRG